VSTGFGQIRAGSGTISPYIGGYTFEGNEDLKTRPAYGLRVGYNFTKHFGIEGYGQFVHTEFDLPGSPDMDVYSFGVEGLWHFMPDNRLVPFIALGLGDTHYDPDMPGVSSRDKFTLGYGPGLKYSLTEDWALRADVRHVMPFNDHHSNVLYTLGISYSFGGKKKEMVVKEVAPVAAAKVEVPKDSDGDGVFDDKDECPNTPKGVAVDERGCPLDSDKDGVPDYRDKCPDTPVGVKVDQDGCPLDSDKDGVPDYRDKCPDTPAGVKVDQDGCPQVELKKEAAAVEKELIEKGRARIDIKFDFNKAVVKPQYHDELQKFADVLKAHPELHVVIEGYTDSVGDDAYNLKLSEKRAASVRKYLIKKFGVDESRVSSKGYGETKPIDTNKTAKGRANNRRVEAVVDYIIKK